MFNVKFRIKKHQILINTGYTNFKLLAMMRMLYCSFTYGVINMCCAFYRVAHSNDIAR